LNRGNATQIALCIKPRVVAWGLRIRNYGQDELYALYVHLYDILPITAARERNKETEEIEGFHFTVHVATASV
jgi:hypothetical protein